MPVAAMPVLAQTPGPIRIGASFSDTGTYAALGQTARRGYALCVKQANERGGVLGRQLELLTENDACEVRLEAIRRAGTLDGEKVREAILKMDFNTSFGAFKVDESGLQAAHKMVLFQWRDGKKAIVWPENLAPAKPRFPTPPWNQR